MKTCRICSDPIGPRSKSGLCRVHGRTHGTGQFKRPRVGSCSDCGVGISDQNVTGRCKPCSNRRLNSDPVHRRKIADGVRRSLENPFARARKAEIARRNARAAYSKPERREAAREVALRHLQLAFTPEAIARKLERQKAAFAEQRDNRLAWCPVEYRDEYRKLLYSKRMHAADARRVIEEAVAADKRRAEAALTPFERQMRALQNGAQLIANDTGPSLANPGDYGERKWSA